MGLYSRRMKWFVMTQVFQVQWIVLKVRLGNMSVRYKSAGVRLEAHLQFSTI
jgi:hypothetical protein